MKQKFLRRLVSFSLAVMLATGSVHVNAMADEKVTTNDSIVSSTNVSVFEQLLGWAQDTLGINKLDSFYIGQDWDYHDKPTAGRVRYINQNKNSSGFYYAYWGTHEGHANMECLTASMSMALSFLGIDKKPVDILNHGKTGNVCSDETCITYATWCSPATYYESTDLKSSINRYINGGGSWSPVIVNVHEGYSTKWGHWFIIDGYDGASTYHVLDPSNMQVSWATINGNTINYGKGSATDPQIYQYYYGAANNEQMKTCMDDSESRYNSANNTIYIQGWSFSTKGNKVTFKATFDNGTTINLANRNDAGMKGYSGCLREDVRFGENINVSFLSPNANHKVTVTAYSSSGMQKTVGSYSFKTSNYSVTTNNAEKITNTSARISGSVSPSGTVAAWGFYYGEGNDTSKKIMVSNTNTSTSNLSCDMKDYTGKLSPGKTYSYKIWVKSGSTEIVSKQSKSFVTSSIKPDNAELRVDSKYSDIGKDTAPVVSWSEVVNADSYTLKLYSSEGTLIQEKTDIIGTQYGFEPVSAEGTYYASITANNEVGSSDEIKCSTPITIHPDVKVSFVDYDDKEISIQTVSYGGDAEKPVNPEREGYTFTGWDKSNKSINEDTIIKAVYEINHYKVIFKDENGNVLSEQSVEYNADAEEPSYSPERADYELYGWDKNTKNIKENMVITAVVGWYNTNFPIYLKEATATRNFEGTVNEGYDVTVKFNNWDQSTTRGRVIVALKTDEGKLLTTTESSAFSIKKDAEKTMDIFVPYDGAAKKAYIYVVERYSDMIPISDEMVVTIDQGLEWSNWSVETPPASATETESRTEYRYRDKVSVKSYDTAMAGWEVTGSSWVKTGSGTVDYAKSWPSGFNTGNYYYSHYKQNPPTANETANTKRTVSTYIDHYLYWHWCRGTYSGGPTNRQTRPYYTGEYSSFHAFISATYVADGASDGSCIFSNGNCCRDSYWYYKVPIYRSTYTDYKKQYTYEKWGDFSEWDANAISSSSTRDVETRTTYRYKTNDFVEDNSGEDRIISGTISPESIGVESYRLVSLLHSESDEKDEPTDDEEIIDGETEVELNVLSDSDEENIESEMNENVDETLIIEDAKADLDVEIVEEERTEETVAVANAGDPGLFSKQLNAILTVYKVDSASDYTTECVAQGKINDDGTYSFNIKLKEEPTTKTGDFTVTLGIEGSDKAVELAPIKAPNAKYTVRFLDWDGTVISTQEVYEGDTAEIPSEENMVRDGYIFRRWSLPNTNIHKDTDIVAEYIQKTYHVVYVDWAAKSVVEEEHNYGDELIPPIPSSNDNSLVASWDKIDDGITTVSANMVLCTVYRPRKCEVQIYDDSYSLVSTQSVDYGTSPDLSVIAVSKEKEVEWDICGADNVYEPMESTIITDNVKIRATEVKNEQVATPVSDVESGEYNSSKTVTLSTETAGAKIYYTTDGSTPTPASNLYTAPISISETTVLNYVAVKEGFNNSQINTNYYIINSDPGNKKHLVRVAKDGLEKDEFFIVNDGANFSKKMVAKPEHATILSLYKDEEKKNIWTEQDVVTSSMLLYADCEKDSFVVKFVDGDGEIIYREGTEYGGLVAVPSIPEVEGYTAVGWSTDDFNFVTQNLVVKPVYTDGTDPELEDDVNISLDKKEVSLVVGEELNLTYDINRSWKSLTWSSDNLSVATVSAYGKIKATGVGQTVVKVQVNGTTGFAECKVTVCEGIVAKQKKDISGSFSTTERIDRYVVSPKNKASVTKKGVLKAKKEGYITITAQQKIGKKYVDLESIYYEIKIPKFKNVEITELNSTVNMNDYLINADGFKPVWSLSKKSAVAEIDSNGVLTAKKPGKVTVIAQFGEGKNAAKYKCKVKVVAPK